MSLFSFLGKGLTWIARQGEGKQRGDQAVAQAEASPIIHALVQEGEDAMKGAALSYLAKETGISPTPQGVAGLVGGLIDSSVSASPAAKEVLKLYLDSHLLGSNFSVTEDSAPAAGSGQAGNPGGQAE